MSKQSEARLRQGFVLTPTHPTCGNCIHLDMAQSRTSHHVSTQKFKEKEYRCAIGKFTVRKKNTCDLHEPNRNDLFLGTLESVAPALRK